MKWESRLPKYGDCRDVKKFLFLPASVVYQNIGYDIKETRWLEFVTVRQCWTKGHIQTADHWRNIEFVDKEDPMLFSRD